MAELTYVCANCGSGRLKLIEGEYRTGVTSPDGGYETRWYEGLKCLDCGCLEEI